MANRARLDRSRVTVLVHAHPCEQLLRYLLDNILSASDTFVSRLGARYRTLSEPHLSPWVVLAVAHPILPTIYFKCYSLSSTIVKVVTY